MLTLLLLVKIVGSFVFVSLPFLFLPNSKLAMMTGARADHPGLFRLYGVAITALLVGYSFGVYDSMRGVFPYYAVATGVFSNIGAALMLFLHAPRTTANKAFIGFFGVIGILLLAFLLHAIFSA